jgi:hypothetical protein
MKSPGQHPNTSATPGELRSRRRRHRAVDRRLPGEKETEGDPADAIVWDELAARTREEGLNVTLLTSRQYYPHAGCIGIGRL